MVIWIELKSVRFFCPDTNDVFIRRETTQSLEPAGIVVGVDEQLKVLPELVVAFVVVTFDSGVLDRSVQPLDGPPPSCGRCRVEQ